MAAIQVGNEYATSARLLIPWSGCWHLEIGFDREVSILGRVTARLGNLELVGTVRPDQSGRVGLVSRATIVGGAGWATILGPLPKHSDSGLRKARIGRDAAAACGESLTVDAALDGTVGADWQRRTGPASRTLELLFPDVWYVDAGGGTIVGARPTRDVSGRLEIVTADAAEQWIEAHVADPRDIIPGGTITDARLSSTVTIREAELRSEGQGWKAMLWVGTADQTVGASLRRAVERAVPWARFGLLYRYRVLEMVGVRANLRAVAKRAGVPDAIAVDMAPGMAGLSAELTPGATVLVTFIEGDPALPIVTHFERVGQSGFLPVSLALDASGTVQIGASASSVELGGDATISGTQANTERRFLRLGDPIIFSAPGPGILAAPPANAPFSTARPS